MKHNQAYLNPDHCSCGLKKWKTCPMNVICLLFVWSAIMWWGGRVEQFIKDSKTLKQYETHR